MSKLDRYIQHTSRPTLILARFLNSKEKEKNLKNFMEKNNRFLCRTEKQAVSGLPCAAPEAERQ